MTDRHFWDPHTVARILRNETYKGEWHWNKTRRVKRGDRKVQEPRPREEWLTLPVTPLVDEATWERAQVQLDRNKVQRPPQRQARVPAARARLLPVVWSPLDRPLQESLRPRLLPLPDDRGRNLGADRLLGPLRHRADAAGVARPGGDQGVSARPGDARRWHLPPSRSDSPAERQRLDDRPMAIDRHLADVDQRLGKLLDDALTDGFPSEIIDAAQAGSPGRAGALRPGARAAHRRDWRRRTSPTSRRRSPPSRRPWSGVRSGDAGGTAASC